MALRPFLLGTLVVILLAVAAASAQSLDLTSPGPGQEVAQGDGLTLRGTLLGGGEKVYVWVFDTFAAAPGGLCRSEEATVAGGTFLTTLAGLTNRTGDYTLVVQGLGADGRYSDGYQTGDGKLFGSPERHLRCDDNRAMVGSLILGKQGRDLLTHLQDNARTRIGSDDGKVFQTATFRVAAPRLEASDCPAVPRGQDVVASGTTNRADGTVLQATVSGPASVALRTATVRNGTFSVTVTTSEIPISGTYTVAFDDGRGNSATVRCPVTFVAGSSVLATPSAAPTPAPSTPTPTPAPTPTPEQVVVVATPPPPSPTATAAPPSPSPPPSSPSPTPRQPGFEFLFAVSALTAAGLRLRRW